MSNSNEKEITETIQDSSNQQISYVERFDNERKEWTELIKGIAFRFKIVENLIDVQVDLYSQRQLGIEYMSQLQVLQSKLKKSHLAEWQKAYATITHNEDLRYNEKEKTRFADDNSSLSKLKMEILQSHIDFFKETVKTIDNMIFGVKHRLEIEDFKRGNK